MDTVSAPIELHPVHVANHWPFIERKLAMGRWRAGRRALRIVADLQNELGGEYVALGRSRLAELESGRPDACAPGVLWRALVELEERGVLARRRGSGTRSDVWGFRPDITRWRSMPWDGWGRDVERVVRGCISRAVCPVAARLPGQELVLPRGIENFRISEGDHLPRPGTLVVDRFSFGGDRAASAISPAWPPVESRGSGATISPIRARDNSFEESKILHWETEEHQEVVALIEKAIEAKTDQTYKTPICKPRRQLIELCRFIDIDQARQATKLIARSEQFVQIPWAHTFLRDILSDPSVKRARHTERSFDGDPASLEFALED